MWSRAQIIRSVSDVANASKHVLQTHFVINMDLVIKSNVRETWRVILVSEADIFFTESLRILAERLSQSENGLPLRQICYYSPPEEVGVFSTEIKNRIISVLSLQISQCI